MKHILVPITIDELPVGWEKNFPFDVLSVKPVKAAAALALLPKDKELSLWEWASFRNKEQARAWGEKMANYCAKFKVKTFYVDAEAEWAGGSEGYATVTEPYQNLLEMATAFYLHAPEGTELAYNGFSWDRTSGGIKLHDAALIKLFSAWVPMIYSALEDPRSGFLAKLDRYKAQLPGVLRIPMLYAGRYEKDGSFVGQDWKVQKALIEKSKPDAVAWYFGNGSKSRYNELVAMVKETSSAPTTAPPSPGGNTYTVASGDSWWGLAMRFYNNSQVWPQLKAANGNPKVLHPGDVVVLPTKETLLNART